MKAKLEARGRSASRIANEAVALDSVEIQELSALALVQFEIFPGVRLGDKPLRLPDALLPPSQRNNGLRLIDIEKAFPADHKLGVPRIVEIESTLRRMMLAALLVARKLSSRRGMLPKPSTWCRRCHELINLTRWSLQNRPNEETVFAHLTATDLACCLREGRVYPRTIIDFTKLHELRAIDDWPNLRPEDAKTFNVEKARKNGVIPPHECAHEKRRWQPLPDDFISELGWRCLWFAENVGPNLVALHRELRAIEHLTSKRKASLSKKLIASWKWRLPTGEQLGQLPFTIRILVNGRGHTVVNDIRKVMNRSQIFSLVRSLQVVHGLLIAICMAPRISETVGLTTGSFLPSGNRLTGKTYKLVDDPEGADRDWPVHEVAAAAFLAQIELTEPIRAEDEEFLFLSFKKDTRSGEQRPRGKGAAQIHYERLATLFQLESLLRGTSFHSHRIRKTMVRLVGLALVSAPKILMDLLGHKRLKMTIDYMLSDPAFTAEIQAVSQEMVRLHAMEVASCSEGHGGKAGERLSKFLADRRARRGEVALDVADLEEAATIISLNGLAWQIVRPGLICTKAPFERGLCTKGRGNPDPSKCDPECDYRLEEARFRADVNECISDALANYSRAREAGDELLLSFWRGQVRANLARFKDLEDCWAGHALVQEIRAWEVSVQERQLP